MLPPDVRVARDAQDLLIECCVGKIFLYLLLILGLLTAFFYCGHLFAEFINLVSSESNDVCNKEDKRTIAPEHVLKALQVLYYNEILIHVTLPRKYIIFFRKLQMNFC